MADDDMESLYAQMEREYEEEELKKKAGKKGGKKGGKAGKEEPPVAKEGGEEAGEPTAEDSKAEEKKGGKKKDNKKQPAAKEAKSENKQEEKENNKPVVKKDEPKKATDDKKDKKKTETKPDAEATAADKSAAAESKEDKPKEEASSGKKGGKDAKSGSKPKPKAGVSALKEALEAAKKKEEELLRAEEEQLKREEEARRQREEQERLEKERKQKKKAKEKERIKRQKDEGRYETKEQKEARQRALARLQAMGAKIPGFEEKSAEEQVAAAEEAEEAAENKAAAAAGKAKPKYNRLRKKQTANQANEEAGQEGEQEKEEASGEQQEVEQEEKIKDNWDDDDVKDEWDADESSKASKKEKAKAAHHQTSTTGSTNTATNNANNAAPAGGSEEDESSEDGSDVSSAEEESEEESENENRDLPPAQRVKLRLQKKHDEAEKQRSVDHLRSPVICVLGHVDTGKTKILDNLRRTRVQEDEAGGITQQIGATNVPLETVQERTKMCRHIYKDLLKIPGLLIIDTPGHESFKSLRSRGSSLCDIAILVIDIMHGLEPQTIESINILKEKKTPFVVALNKIDRLFGWKTSPLNDVAKVIEGQAENVKAEFEKRTSETIVQLAEQGLNAALYYRNPDPKTYISMVPTSAHTSDGIGNLMALIVDFAQTILAKRISYSRELQCTVMEVKEIPGLGTTIDVCLVNGKLKVCDTIIIPGQEGPIVTQIRGLLLPQPNRELRVKNSYRNNKEVLGAQGVKVVGKNLEKAMAGLPLFVAHKDDEIDYFKDEIQVMLRQALSSIRLSDTGVFVQASTLGSLEALLEFLRTSKIPYAGISIGPVHKKDITIASIMLEKDPQYAVILAFDVKVEKDAQDLADHLGVKIFTADIIYHLFDKFMGYRDELKQKKREEFKDIAVFPFKLKIMPQFIFNTRDPIICGVKVEAGFVKIGSPVCALCEDPSAEREGKDKFVDLGRITSIEYNHKPQEIAKQGAEVCIRIENTTGGAPKLLGRHFLQSDFLVSKISRDSIDAVKNYFREEMTKSDWQLIIELKKQFQIL